jgi:hypothetical protein
MPHNKLNKSTKTPVTTRDNRMEPRQPRRLEKNRNIAVLCPSADAGIPCSFSGMCRSIKTLRGQAEVTDEEVTAAALQFVRKVSGYRQPSKANQAAFESAVSEVAASTARLLEAVGSPGTRPT